MRAALAAAALLLACAPARPGDWPMLGGRPDRNMVADEKGLPAAWSWDPDPKKNVPKKNIKWIADLGTMAWSTPVVAGGRVLIGTNNEKPRDPQVKGDRGVLMCFSAADGSFQWQAVHEKLHPNDQHKAMDEDWAQQGVCSTAAVAGDSVYYVSNRAELVCCDLQGFSDGENDGPFKAEARTGKQDADLIWVLDMRKDLGVKPHQASASSPLVVGGLVYVLTGNGVDEKGEIKNPQAPSFLAVEAATGQIAWRDSSPGDKILAAQWSSPAYGEADGQPQVVFPGGDGWLYSFEPKTGKLLWKINCRTHEPVRADGKPETRNNLVATPVFVGHRVLVAVGHEPDSPNPTGCLRAIDARKRGDITKDGELWRLADKFGSTLSTVSVHEGLVYAAEQDGYLNCVELETGKRLWRHDLLTTVWGSPLVADGKVYLRTGDDEVIVLAIGREIKALAKNGLKGLNHGSVIASGGVLYMAGGERLFAVATDK